MISILENIILSFFNPGGFLVFIALIGLFEFLLFKSIMKDTHHEKLIKMLPSWIRDCKNMVTFFEFDRLLIVDLIFGEKEKIPINKKLFPKISKTIANWIKSIEFERFLIVDIILEKATLRSKINLPNLRRLTITDPIFSRKINIGKIFKQ